MKKALFTLLVWTLFSTSTVLASNHIGLWNLSPDSIVSDVVQKINTLMEQNYELAKLGRLNEISYVINVDFKDDMTAVVLGECDPWIKLENVVIPDDAEDLCTQFKNFNNANNVKVQHYIIYIKFPKVVLGTDMIAAQHGEQQPLSYYTQNQDDGNYQFFEDMHEEIKKRLNIDLLQFPTSGINEPEKIMTIVGQWYIGRNNDSRLAASIGRTYKQSEFLTPSVMAHFYQRCDEAEAADHGGKFSLASRMWSTISYFTNFVHPFQDCEDLEDELDFNSAQTFVSAFCAAHPDIPDDKLPYLWSLAKYIDGRQSRHPTNADLDPGEISFIEDLLEGYLGLENEPWDEYLMEQIVGNGNRNFLGYIEYTLGTQQDFTPTYTAENLRYLIVQYFYEVFEDVARNYFVNEYRRTAALNLLNAAYHQMNAAECATLLQELESRISSPATGLKRACVGALWELCNLTWNSGHVDVEVINLINRIAVKAKGITRQTIGEIVENEPERIVYWKFNTSSVADLGSIPVNDRIDYSYDENQLLEDFSEVTLTLKQCDQITCTLHWTWQELHEVCECAHYYDANEGSGNRYENLSPFELLYVVSPTNVMFLDLCGGENADFCKEGASPVTALSLALSLEKEADETTEQNVILAATILSTVLTFGEAYPLIASSGLLRLYGGFKVLNEVVLNQVEGEEVDADLLAGGVDADIAASIGNSISILKVAATAIDFATIGVDDMIELSAKSKIAKYQIKVDNPSNDVNQIPNFLEALKDIEDQLARKVESSSTLKKVVIRDYFGINNIPNENLSEELIELMSKSKARNFDFGPEINTLTGSQQLKLINDLSANASLANDLSELPMGIKAWKMLEKRTEMRKNKEVLSKMNELLVDPSFVGNWPNGNTDFQVMVDNMVHPCCGAPNPYLKPLIEHLDDVKYFINTLNGKTGFASVVSAIKHPLYTVQDGTSHLLTKVRSLNPNDIIQFEGNIVDGIKDIDNLDDICTNCLFDIEITGPTRIEMKSYLPSTINGISGSLKFCNQFKAYLAGAPNMTRIKYIFNGRKVTDLEMIKTNFQTIFVNNAQDYYNTFGQTKFTQLFGVNNVQDFLEDVASDLDNAIYDFIEIQ